VVDLPVAVDPRLRETSMGKWEGLTRDEVVAEWEPEWNAWRTTSAHASPPGGESRWQVAQRAAAVVDELDDDRASRALLVSHGGTIVGLTGRLLALPEDSWGTLIGIGNCHWVVLHRYAGAWRLHSYNAGLGGLVLPRGEDQVAGT
jgi:2,3-bisphosphoglycerate-dependent phosphoglycerate mutase/probable phosphoglycerate mutase